MVGSMNSPNGAYGELCTTIGGCFDVLASHVSPAASKTIHQLYAHPRLYDLKYVFHTKSHKHYSNTTTLDHTFWFLMEMQTALIEEEMIILAHIRRVCTFEKYVRISHG